MWVSRLMKKVDDRLAQCALRDDTVDPGIEYTLGYVKSSIIKNFVHSSISDQLEFCCLHLWETHCITR
ncbi:hypothetical protein E2C01_094897 [Portunus trituberculatus]|uniref:Uncharacterized protein n=1 Tax=Portunus trituberculatus TaxID=210409 RepID=A0A5B7JNE0_PORTR|nr:hypothetical protein [Portunus trituberculatus]